MWKSFAWLFYVHSNSYFCDCVTTPQKDCVIKLLYFSIVQFWLGGLGGSAALYPVRVLTDYIRRTQTIRKTHQFFVCFNHGVVGRPL